MVVVSPHLVAHFGQPFFNFITIALKDRRIRDLRCLMDSFCTTAGRGSSVVCLFFECLDSGTEEVDDIATIRQVSLEIINLLVQSRILVDRLLRLGQRLFVASSDAVDHLVGLGRVLLHPRQEFVRVLDVEGIPGRGHFITVFGFCFWLVRC